MKTLLKLVIVCGLSGQMLAQTTGWNNGGANPYRNGHVDVAGPVTDSVLWEVSRQGVIGFPMLIEGNRMVTMDFLGMQYAPVTCYDLDSGELLWSVDVSDATGRSLPVGFRDGRVFVVGLTESGSDLLVALDAADGTVLWTASETVNPYITETGVFDAFGDFYITGSNLTLLKLNPETGDLIWSTPVVPMASGSAEMAINPVLHRGYTLEQNGGISYVWAIDLATGEKLFSAVVPDLQPGGNVPQTALHVGFNGAVYVQLTQDNIAALTDTGSDFTLDWQTTIEGNSAFSLMCVGADGSVYAPSGGKLIRMHAETGAVLATSPTITQGGFFSPRISASGNGMVYATNGENGVFAFDEQLNIVWSDDLPNSNTSGANLAPSGALAVCGANTVRVYAPVAQTGLDEGAAAAWAAFPNPATSFVQITAPETLSGRSYSLFDIRGILVDRGSFGEQSPVLDVSEWPAGVYVLAVDGLGAGLRIVKE
jgi:outer membrane protein assembly factor BamB